MFKFFCFCWKQELKENIKKLNITLMSANDKDRQKHNLKYTENIPRYLFGDDLSGSLKREDFVKLQSDLISDVLEMEFTRYFKSEFLSWSIIQTFQFSFLQTQNFLTVQVR